MPPNTHTEPGCSGLGRVWGCPGSSREIRKLPQAAFTSSPAAEEGTLAGAHAEARLKTGKWDAACDVEMRDFLDTYVDYVEAWARSEAGALLLVEQRVQLSPFAPKLGGTADAIVWLPESRTLVVVDLKYGRGVDVQAQVGDGPNPQIAAYALGACCTFDYRPAKVVLAICQVRKPDPIRVCEMTGIGLLEWGFRLEDVIRQTDDPDSPLVPGEKQCRFCPFAPQCPALRELATVTARQEFAPAIEYDPADLQKALDLAPVLRTWANAVEDFAKDEAKAGRVVPGWKLVESLGNRKWRDESVAGEAILAANEDLDIYNYKMKSPAQIEKLLGKEHKDLVAGLVTRESTGVTLVRDTDKRSTVSTDPTKEFEKING